MTLIATLFSRPLRRAVPLALACAAGLAFAHGPFNVGAVQIGHPFATPSIPGTTNGAAYLAGLDNNGDQPDKLVRASTPAATRVELHTMAVDAQGVMRMREVDGIALAPKSKLQMKPGSGVHLMLIGLKEPLKEGATFPMTLEFERAGKVEVGVIVQAPKAGGESHMH